MRRPYLFLGAGLLAVGVLAPVAPFLLLGEGLGFWLAPLELAAFVGGMGAIIHGMAPALRSTRG